MFNVQFCVDITTVRRKECLGATWCVTEKLRSEKVSIREVDISQGQTNCAYWLTLCNTLSVWAPNNNDRKKLWMEKLHTLDFRYLSMWATILCIHAHCTCSVPEITDTLMIIDHRQLQIAAFNMISKLSKLSKSWWSLSTQMELSPTETRLTHWYWQIVCQISQIININPASQSS